MYKSRHTPATEILMIWQDIPPISNRLSFGLKKKIFHILLSWMALPKETDKMLWQYATRMAFNISALRKHLIRVLHMKSLLSDKESKDVYY